MIELIDKDTGQNIGQISEEEMQFLVESLEEEGLQDQDYYFDNDGIEYLKERGLSPNVEAMLNAAVAGKDGVEIIFKKK